MKQVGVASKLQIIKFVPGESHKNWTKLCFLQTSLHPSQWFVSIMQEEENTEEN
jgi:hypothetical protein